MAGIQSAEYRCWQTVRRRCLTPTAANYERYGGRGVTICDKWRDSFDAFLADVGRRPSPLHSIDRWPDNSRGYEPGNVRWATATEQARNRRDTVFLTHMGETRCLTEWANIFGIDRSTLNSRLKMDWSVDRALTSPIDHRRRRKG